MIDVRNDWHTNIIPVEIVLLDEAGEKIAVGRNFKPPEIEKARVSGTRLQTAALDLSGVRRSRVKLRGYDAAIEAEFRVESI